MEAKNTTDRIEVNGTNDIAQDEINKETTTANDEKNKPDEGRFFKDLTENQCNTLSYAGTTDTITIPIEKITLDKAKEDEDIYIAYCTLELKNEYYEGKVLNKYKCKNQCIRECILVLFLLGDCGIIKKIRVNTKR